MEGKALKESRERRKRDRASERGGNPCLVGRNLNSSFIPQPEMLFSSIPLPHFEPPLPLPRPKLPRSLLASHPTLLKNSSAIFQTGPPRARGEQRMDR